MYPHPVNTHRPTTKVRPMKPVPASSANPRLLAKGTFCSQDLLDKLSYLEAYKPDLSGYFKNQSPTSSNASTISSTSSSGYNSMSPESQNLSVTTRSSPAASKLLATSSNCSSGYKSKSQISFPDVDPASARSSLAPYKEPTFTPSPKSPVYPNVDHLFNNPMAPNPQRRVTAPKRSYKVDELLKPDQTPKRPKTIEALPNPDAAELLQDFEIVNVDALYSIVMERIVKSANFSNIHYKLSAKFHTYTYQQKAFVIQFLTESDLKTAHLAHEPLAPEDWTPLQRKTVENFEKLKSETR